MPASPDVTWHPSEVQRADRERLHGHRGVTVWLTGLSGAGKSSIAHRAERLLHARGCSTYVLDGDNVRHGLCGDLDFSPEARRENVRRVAEVARLFTDAGVIVLVALVSPYRRDRERARRLHGPGDFVEVYVEASLNACEARDPKGLYAKARAGRLRGFTGIDAPYEAPERPELRLPTERRSVDESARALIAYLEQRGYLSPPP